MDKTNVLRFLDRNSISYGYHSYAESGAVSGTDAAAALGQEPGKVFKTLVMRGTSKTIYVFLVSVNHKLDQKKAAGYLGEKAIEMVKGKELQPLTGYVHGGCSPLKMRKKFRTIIDTGSQNYETILLNAGMVGYMVEITLENLKKVLEFEVADIVD